MWRACDVSPLPFRLNRGWCKRGALGAIETSNSDGPHPPLQLVLKPKPLCSRWRGILAREEHHSCFGACPGRRPLSPSTARRRPCGRMRPHLL
eukprot:scaffold161396_cov30-Tisochrysis_lutea.AAC.12